MGLRGRHLDAGVTRAASLRAVTGRPAGMWHSRGHSKEIEVRRWTLRQGHSMGNGCYAERFDSSSRKSAPSVAR